ncbi:MAG: hypothetical protein OIF32_02340 [Campylobacterales bacterium]|nr:hypothetical protein [Campylobacterales bacterium]
MLDNFYKSFAVGYESLFGKINVKNWVIGTKIILVIPGIGALCWLYIVYELFSELSRLGVL